MLAEQYERRVICLTLKLNANDRRLKYEVAIDEALSLAADTLVAGPNLLGQHIHPTPGQNLTAEPNILDATKADKATPAQELCRVKRSDLSCQLDLEHTGKQRATRNMPSHPKLVVPHMFESDDLVARIIDVAHAIEHLELVSLGDDLADGFLVKKNLGQIYVGDIEKGDRGHGGRDCEVFEGWRILLKKRENNLTGPKMGR